MRPKHGKLDRVLLFTAFLIALIGVLSVYSATWDKAAKPGELDPLVIRQIIWVLIGGFFLLVFSNISYLKILDFAYILYGLNLLALLFLLIFGGERYGAKRWIDFGPFSLQPSEFVKLTTILALAAFLGERREKIKNLSSFIGGLLIIAPAGLLIFLQPDLGTAFIFVPVFFAVMYICGGNVKHIMVTLISGLVSMPIFWHFLKDYQKSRLMVFINPNVDPLGAGYTIIQSKIAVGSGGFIGKGWLNGTQSHLKFLPEKHTDFIFSVIGEEWGFVGGLILIGVYMALVIRGMKIISDVSDIYGKAIATGIVTLIAFQMFTNISMTIGIMPVVGLPLPAISYGGSNTLMFLINVGILLSISRRTNL